MIAFGAAVTDEEAYARCAAPGIRLAAEPDSALLIYAAVGSVARTANLLLEAAARLADLEALVLVDPRAEITDPAFCARVREALRDPDVGLAGALGAAGARGPAWWDGDVSGAPVLHRFEEHGGGVLGAYAWTRPAPPPRDVETVDGRLLALSAWAVRTIRFDEALRRDYGVEADYCRQVRAAGRRVRTADLRHTQHRSLELVEDVPRWLEAHVQLAAKWEPVAADDPGWRGRARRAEAEREAERALTSFDHLVWEALIRDRRRVLEGRLASRSWRLTEPLRRLNRARARLISRASGGSRRG
jgi:hypothetical protein